MGRGESRGEYMDEIYTIWVGEYSEKYVIGVAYDKEIADAYAKLHDGYVLKTPIVTDRNFITRANNMIVRHSYRYDDYELMFVGEDKVEPDEKLLDIEAGSYIDVYVYRETDRKKSRKIASDKLMKFLSERLEFEMLNEERNG